MLRNNEENAFCYVSSKKKSFFFFLKALQKVEDQKAEKVQKVEEFSCKACM